MQQPAVPRASGTQACWHVCQQRLLRLQNHSQDPCPVTRQHCLNMPACMNMQNEGCPGCFLLLLHRQEAACRCLLDGQVQCATTAAATAAPSTSWRQGRLCMQGLRSCGGGERMGWPGCRLAAGPPRTHSAAGENPHKCSKSSVNESCPGVSSAFCERASEPPQVSPN